MAINISSLNTKGIGDKIKRREIKEKIGKDEILLIQESHGNTRLWERSLSKTESSHSTYNNAARGCTTLTNNELNQVYTDNSGRLCACYVKVNSFKILVINTYAPVINNTLASKREYRNLLTKIKGIVRQAQPTDNILLAGDFNVVIDENLDNLGQNPTRAHDELATELLELMDELELYDAFRIVYPNKREFSFAPIGQNPNKIYRRLDYAFISYNLIDKLEDATYMNTWASDHKILRLRINPTGIKQKKGLWRHNNQHNKDPEFIEGLKLHIRDILLNSTNESPATRWEWLKHNIGKFCRNFGAMRAKEDKAEMEYINNRLEVIEQDPCENHHEIVELRERIMEREIRRLERECLFARAQYIKEYEKSSAFFYRTAKTNTSYSNIIALEKNNRKLTPVEINNEIHNYYKKLYKEETRTPIEQRLNDLPEWKYTMENLNKINERDKELLNNDIQEEELRETIYNSMNKGKSPGNDGITLELYQLIWEEIKEPFTGMINYSLNTGILPPSMRQSVIRLIRKKNKTPAELKNWRPISLLNVDTKILSRTITRKITPLLSQLIGSDQNAFIKGRNITYGNRTLDYVITEAQGKNDMAVIAIDFEKAFDSVNHEYLYETLRYMNFPNKLINMVRTLYHEAESAVLNNGLTTKYFPLERSCRQGDALSPYLFIMALEPLLVRIRSSMRGYDTSVGNIKTLAYADDLTVIIKDKDDYVRLNKLLGEFGILTGLKMNKEKTEILLVGNDNGNRQFPAHLIRNKITVTGITYGRNKDIDVSDEMYIPRLNKTAGQYNSWKQRNLSILGKVNIIKTMGLSQFQHLFNVMDTPEDIVKQLVTMTYKFLWNGSDKITRNVAEKKIEDGGISMPLIKNIINASLAAWIPKAFMNTNLLWAQFLIRDLEYIGGLLGLLSRRRKKDFLGMNEFNVKVFRAWMELNTLEPTPLPNQNIYGNWAWAYGNPQTLIISPLSDYNLLRYSDFFDYDGRLIDLEGARTRGLPLELSYEFARVSNILRRKMRRVTVHRGTCPRVISLRQDRTEPRLRIGRKILIGEDIKQKNIIEALQCVNNHMNPHWSWLKDKLILNAYEQQRILKSIKLISTETKMRSFIIRKYNGILYGNKMLKKFNHKQTDACGYCNTPEQTFDHLISECIYVRNFIQGIVHNIQPNQLVERLYIGSDTIAESYIYHAITRYIYQKNLNDEHMVINELLGLIREHERVEGAMCTTGRERYEWLQKWICIRLLIPKL